MKSAIMISQRSETLSHRALVTQRTSAAGGYDGGWRWWVPPSLLRIVAENRQSWNRKELLP
jgi:hypothetical protein